MREGAGKSLAECLRMEFRMVHQCVLGKSDFVEGVRALLIDKTGKPKWDPPSIQQVRLSQCEIRGHCGHFGVFHPASHP